MHRIQIAAACSIVSLLSIARAGTVSATIDVDVNKPGVEIPPSFYGLMTEDINHAYDGGLYAELIQNRSFQDRPMLAHWSGEGDARIAITRDGPLNENLPASLQMTLSGGTGRLANDGYWGIPVKPATTYTASFFAKAGDGFSGAVTASIVGADGIEYATATSEVIGQAWKKFTLTLKTAADVKETSQAKFVLSASGKGALTFSLVSLFPPTYKDAPNGLRPDLMQLMADMHPAFIRLPGGNFLEGDYLRDRFDWKKTIGPVEQRPGHRGPWSYRSSDGLGLPEMLLWCKQLNAEPVLAVFAGYTLRKEIVKAGPALDKYVQEALEEIEYVSGPADSEWGKKRVADGFPEPFKLTYVEVGNEDWFDDSGSYEGRFAQFYDAIRKKYPDLKIIATMPVRSRKPDLIDDHYYLSPGRMAAQGTHYHPADRNGSQIFLGEWAAQDGNPTPTLRSAVADAAFLIGLEKDADLIPMECYAPLLVNVNPGAAQWGTNLIGYDALHAFGSPSYYAQAMLAQNKTDVVLPTVLNVAARDASQMPSPHGAIGVGSWHTQTEFKDISVTQNGKPLLANDPAKSIDGWHTVGGDWKSQDGILKPVDREAETWAYTGDASWTDYTLSLKARKIGGAEGFLVLWHAVDDGTYRWLNVGGWGNTRTTAEAGDGGEREPYGPSSDFAVQMDKWYDVRIEVTGGAAKCFIDGKLVTEVQSPPEKSKLFASAGYIKGSGEAIIKVANTGDDSIDATLNLRGAKISATGKAYVLTGQPGDINTVEEPTKIAPRTDELGQLSPSFKRVFPPHSLTLIRVKAAAE